MKQFIKVKNIAILLVCVSSPPVGLYFEMSDYIIFKFKKINKNLLKSLLNSELYFARPDRLNDPFDCRFDNIFSSLENAISRASGLTRNDLGQLREVVSSMNMGKFKTDLENVGVCSFSLELENTLMWSHYADNHRGVCLTYEPQDLSLTKLPTKSLELSTSTTGLTLFPIGFFRKHLKISHWKNLLET